MTPEELKVAIELTKAVGKDIYNDLAKPSVTQAGIILSDIVKTASIVTLPFAGTAAVYDVLRQRLQQYILKAACKVPAENIVTPSNSQLLQILDQLKFRDEADIISDMYTELMARSIDKGRRGEVHPAFIHLISQLCSDEVLLVEQLSKAEIKSYMRPAGFNQTKNPPVFLEAERHAHINQSQLSTELREHLLSNTLRPEELASSEFFYVYIEHLVMLGIIQYSNASDLYNMGKNGATFESFALSLTEFGRMFHRACVSDIDLQKAPPITNLKA